jgi:hypothetical protein
MSDISETSDAILAAFQTQVEWCAHLGSPFTAAVLRAMIGELQPGAPLAEIIGAWPGDPMTDVLPLRVAGALHALVLAGAAPELAAVYPPHELPDDASLRAVLVNALRHHRGFIKRFIESPPQTNEVGRSAVLLGGFFEIAAATGLPLRLLEIGASAGLNLLWDRFYYRLGDADWGDPASPVHLAPLWQGGLPPLATPIRVASRTGCDLNPIDVTDDEQALRLRAYVWADQTDRRTRLDGAIALAHRHHVTIERTNATDFLRRHLAAPTLGQATVIYHSIVWNYVSDADKAAIVKVVRDAAQRATPASPLAWLRFELKSKDQYPELDLTLWPNGQNKRLAVANPHGASVAWLPLGETET